MIPERSSLFCSARNRKNQPCSRIAHWVDPDGTRFCVDHHPETSAKSAIKCEGRLRDDSQCSSQATTLVGPLGDEVPFCAYHARAAKLPASPTNEDGLSEETERMLGTLQGQLAASAGEVFAPIVVPQLRKLLLSDNATASLGAMRLLMDMFVRQDGSTGVVPEVDWDAADLDYSTISSQEALRAAAFPTKRSWQEEFSKDKNPAARVDWILRVAERAQSGAFVDPDELEQVQSEVRYIKNYRAITEPIEALTFEPRL